jgi:hypothetical protein
VNRVNRFPAAGERFQFLAGEAGMAKIRNGVPGALEIKAAADIAEGAYSRAGLTSEACGFDQERGSGKSNGDHLAEAQQRLQATENDHGTSITPLKVLKRDLSYRDFAKKYGPLLDQVYDEMEDRDLSKSWSALRKRSKLVELLRTAAVEGHLNAYRTGLRLLLSLLSVPVPDGVVSPFRRAPGARRKDLNKQVCAKWDSMGNPTINRVLCEKLAIQFHNTAYFKGKEGSTTRKVAQKDLLAAIDTALRNHNKRKI